jgi:hypothetical protein
VVAELCDPVVEDVEGALEMEGDEEEEGDDALGVTAGAFEMEGEDEDALGVGAVAVDGVLGVTAGEEEEGEEGEDALDVGAVAVDGVLDVTAGVTEGAAVTDELGVPVEYVTFFTTSVQMEEK